MQACDRCHSRKTRCDRRIPQCSACERAGTACLHVDKLRQRNVPRGYVESMEIQVQQLLEENRKLRGELAPLRNQPQDNQYEGRNDEDEGNQVNEINRIAAINTERNTPCSQEDVDSTSLRSPAGTVRSNVITEVGYLSLKATGETRYLGSSSGVWLASIIDTVVDPEKRIPLLSIEPTTSNGQGSHSTASTPSDESFPSFTTAMSFIEAYFQHTHVTFPLLHRPSFLRTVDLIYNQPGYYENHSYDSYTFNMVLAIGSSNFNRFEEATARPALHYSRAQAGLKSVLALPGLLPLRAIILLSQHGIFSNLRDTSASIYHLVGVGARMCFEQGLHSDSKYINGQQKPASDVARRVSFDDEMRRRCFWCLYNLDRVVSFTLGRPAALRDEDINVSLPSHLADEHFSPDKPIIEDTNMQGSPDHHISPFIHLIRIRRLSGEIMSQFYSINQKGVPTYEQKILARAKLYNKLVAWRNDIQLLRLRERPADERTHVSCFLTPEWYTAVFNNAVLLLYRPSPCLPQASIPQAIENEGDHMKLFLAAKETILAYADLHRRRRLNYSWITLHGVFVAGLAYVYGVRRALKYREQRASSFDFLEIINDTRACSNVLVAISERWNMGHRSCELFNQLSTSVIRDVVNAIPNGRRKSDEGSANNPQPRESNSTLGNRPRNAQNQVQQSHYDPPIDTDMLGQELLPGHVSVIDEFRHYSTAFDGMFMGNETWPNELLSNFSEDWPFEESFLNPGDNGNDAENGTHMHNLNSMW